MAEGSCLFPSTDNAPVTVQGVPRKKSGRKPHAITQKQLRAEARARADARRDRIEKAVALAKDGMTIDAASTLVGVSRTAVRRGLARLGITKKKGRRDRRLPDDQITAKTVYLRRWSEKYPEKRAAHKAVERAILAGKLSRQPCDLCGAVRTEAHHQDYSKPLDVQWLCRPCHMQVHRMAAE